MASKKGKAKTDGPSIQPYCEALKASNVTGADNKVIRKWEAAIQIWSYALGDEDEREEVFKTGCLPNLLGLLERGEPDEKYAAIGALHALAASEKHVSEVVTNKALASAAVLLAGDQPRVKLPAAQFLALAAARPEYVNRVADVALTVLVDTAKQGGPGWGQMRQTLMHCVAALRLLLENVEGESSDVKQSRRLQVINGGAVPALVHMVAYQPRLPDPEEVPAPPPKPVKKSSSKKASSKDVSKGPMLGHKDTLATSAAACLRFLALCPSFVEELTGSGCLPEIIHALLSANAEQAAFIAGVLWEICAEEAVARKAMDLKVVPALLHVASRFCAGMGGKKKKGGKKKSKGKDEPAPKKKEDRRAEPAPPPPINFAEVAVCNAAGALHHLTFLDDAKVQVGQLNGVAIMAACLKSPSPQVYENVTGVLWNVGLHIANGAALEDAGAPEYLVHPVPERWMLYEDEDASASDGSGVSSQEDNGVRDAVFMTQQPPL